MFETFFCKCFALYTWKEALRRAELLSAKFHETCANKILIPGEGLQWSVAP